MSGSAEPGALCLLQGNLDAATTAAIMRAARQRGMLLCLNPSPVDPAFTGLLCEADLLVLNREEACAFAGGIDAAAMRALGAPRVIVTLGGEEGAVLITADAVELVPTKNARVIYPTGAGDVFLATALAHAAERAWQPDRGALAAASTAAALTVARLGAFAALPTQDELSEIIGP